MQSEPKLWTHKIQVGPNGEQSYSWVYDTSGEMVGTFKIHHAVEVVKAMNPSPISADAVVEALEKLIDACEADFGIPGEYDEDDEAVGGGLKEDGSPDPMAVTFGHLRHARAAIRALKGTFPAAPEAKSGVAGWVTPLEWNTAWGPYADGDVCFTAGTPFGSFNVERLNGSWRWMYCFDEYYYEESFECEDEADGKQKAQEHWNGRLAPFIRSALVDPEGGV